jgi:acetyl esterase/lipase
MSNQLTRRDFAIRSAGFGLALGLAPAATLAEAEQASRSETSPAVADPYSLVDPEFLPALKQFPAVDLSAEIVRKFRQSPSMPPLPGPAPQPVERHIPGPPGAPEVRLWVVDPAPAEKSKPVLLHMHGGGFMMPDPWLLPRLQGIATDCHCVVVSVDYRLAPETRYPGSLEDNYAALKWVHAHAAELGIDRSRIAVGGESAGGGHAASLAIHARDRNEVPIVFQLLIYPGLDDRTGSTRPAPPAVGHFMWNASANRLAWSSLLGVPAGSSRVPAAAVPARVATVAACRLPGSVSVLSTCSSKKTWSTRAGSSTPESQPNSWSCVVPSTDSISSCRTPKPLSNSARVGSLRCARHSPLAKLFSRKAESVAAECTAVRKFSWTVCRNSGPVVRRPNEGIGNPPALKAIKWRPRLPP